MRLRGRRSARTVRGPETATGVLDDERLEILASAATWSEPADRIMVGAKSSPS